MDWYGYLCGEAHSEPDDPAYRRVQSAIRSVPFNRFHPEIGADVYRECRWPASAGECFAHTIAVYDSESGGEPRERLPLPRVCELWKGDTLTWRLPHGRDEVK